MSQTSLADALTAAIKAEHEGHYFYQMAASSTQDPRGKEVFGRLAADELLHMEYLQRQYQAVMATGAPDAGLTLAPAPTGHGGSPIFSEALVARVEQAHFEMTALSVGMQLELSAQDFYRAQAEASDDDTARAFFTELASWEASHYQALQTQQESLRDSYWTENRFAPF